MALHFDLQEELCVTIDPHRYDWPHCCTCNKSVDWFGRMLEIDKMAGRLSVPLLDSPSYNRMMVIHCHGAKGIINMDFPDWKPNG